MSYSRQLSPGSRRLTQPQPGRASENLAEPYRYERHNSYQTSPRSSGGVIPLSTQTFVNNPPPSATSTRPEQRFDPYSGRPTDSYTGRPRRNSQVDTHRSSVSGATLPSRSRPTVIQDDITRPLSPLKGSRDKDYYVTPALTKEPRKTEHKKVYSVNDGTASLVADVNAPAGGERHERHHRRRDSETGERSGYRGAYTERDRGRRGYHLNGPVKPKEKSIEDEDAYSYTDPASMYRDTEPPRREVRPRRGSVDRGGASRERSNSLLDAGYDPRKSNKEIGPPPSTRGWDRVNELGRASSTRERSRDVPRSPNRARVPQSPTRARAPMSPTRGRYPEAGAYGDPRDPYYVPPRTSSEDRSRNMTFISDRSIDRQDPYVYDDRREPRRHERRNSVTRSQRPDVSVERRGFGIRSDSQDRYGRGSDENFDRRPVYRDSGYAVAEPHRRDTAPEIKYQEARRLEQEKNDRLAAERTSYEDRDRPHDREIRDSEPRRRDDDRVYTREQEYDRDGRRDRDREYDVDRERERERERMLQPQPEPERHHHRHGSNRDRDFASRDDGTRGSGETLSQSGLSSGAAGLAGAGLAAAAAGYGLNKAHNRNEDRDRERDLDPDRRYDRPRDRDPDRLSPRPPDVRPQEAHSDEGLPYQRERDRQKPVEQERGLGFAFENPPEPPPSAPPIRDRPALVPAPIPAPPMTREPVDDRDFEGQHEDPPALDPDEDYRRRMEQVQRELGRAPEPSNTDLDADRERRRREREQRQRDRDMRNGDSSIAGTGSTFDTAPSSRMPGSFEEGSVDGTNSTASRPGLRRRRSILDEPMSSEPGAMIIDNTMSERKENRVRIVDPPTEEEERKPKGILKRPTQKFPDYPDAVREGVAPLKDATKSGIPPGARWTKIDRRLVNPQALEEAKERFEERLDCVIVLRVLTKEDIQKLADRTRQIRGKHSHSHHTTSDHEHSSASSDHTSRHDSALGSDTAPSPSSTEDDMPSHEDRGRGKRRAWTVDAAQDERYEEEKEERKAEKRKERRNHDRRERDEYEVEDSEDEFKPRKPKMLEAPSTVSTATGTSAGAEQTDFVRDSRDRRRDRDADRESQYMSGGLGRRDEYLDR